MLEISSSDGPIWAQLLADERSYDLHTYAIGGATSDNSLVQGFLVSKIYGLGH